MEYSIIDFSLEEINMLCNMQDSKNKRKTCCATCRTQKTNEKHIVQNAIPNNLLSKSSCSLQERTIQSLFISCNLFCIKNKRQSFPANCCDLKTLGNELLPILFLKKIWKQSPAICFNEKIQANRVNVVLKELILGKEWV